MIIKKPFSLYQFNQEKHSEGYDDDFEDVQADEDEEEEEIPLVDKHPNSKNGEFPFKLEEKAF